MPLKEHPSVTSAREFGAPGAATNEQEDAENYAEIINGILKQCGVSESFHAEACFVEGEWCDGWWKVSLCRNNESFAKLETNDALKEWFAEFRCELLEVASKASELNEHV